ncbi:MAG TPA: tRNA (adenosine(37)-N6)-threonylcarbamoyltransferase complex dimerization subunit type 1 TsaB [Thermomicrobiales bacterium]|nr:tRNA (adenosine(37)-N6)-threonylcarbamoyltransferase complex dimerization subunit type 1 TsaB [Thermomicrobiales bacterium]
MLLALDTSTETAGIALHDGERLAESVWPAGRTQTTSVLPEIDALLARCGSSIEDVGAVAVAIGPGTFTGLRVGLSIAKGLVLARDLPVIGVPTLAIAAAPFVQAEVSVLAVLPAGRGRVVSARVPAQGRMDDPANMAFADFVAHAEVEGLLVLGELSAEQRAALTDRGVRVASAGASVRRPAVLAELAMARWAAGETDDPATLEPLYVHGVQATTKPVVDRLRRSS